jgi:hypothetical protein
MQGSQIRKKIFLKKWEGQLFNYAMRLQFTALLRSDSICVLIT